MAALIKPSVLNTLAQGAYVKVYYYTLTWRLNKPSRMKKLVVLWSSTSILNWILTSWSFSTTLPNVKWWRGALIFRQTLTRWLKPSSRCFSMAVMVSEEFFLHQMTLNRTLQGNVIRSLLFTFRQLSTWSYQTCLKSHLRSKYYRVQGGFILGCQYEAF